jgi:WhiB family redox-sensing transcriptional regulator
MPPLRGNESLSSKVMERDGAQGSPDDGGGLPRGFEDAACRPYPTPWWFADGPDDVEATLICMRCPVRRACLDYALEHPELVGIWAATTAQERVEIRAARHPSLGLRRPGEEGRGH